MTSLQSMQNKFIWEYCIKTKKHAWSPIDMNNPDGEKICLLCFQRFVDHKETSRLKAIVAYIRS